jgi:hypothetical protein
MEAVFGGGAAIKANRNDKTGVSPNGSAIDALRSEDAVETPQMHFALGAISKSKSHI